MSATLEQAGFVCPWCWESVTMLVDLSAGDQQYVEDCPVCCHPIDVSFHMDGDGQLAVEATRTQ